MIDCSPIRRAPYPAAGLLVVFLRPLNLVLMCNKTPKYEAYLQAI